MTRKMLRRITQMLRASVRPCPRCRADQADLGCPTCAGSGVVFEG